MDLIIILLVSLATACSGASLIHEPTDVYATLNSTVYWQCSARTNEIRELYWSWTVNGTSTSTSQFIPSGMDTPDGFTNVTLTIERALIAYNNSRVQCILRPANRSAQDISSRYAVLILQAEDVLGAVTDLVAKPSESIIQLSWVAPFSLDISASNDVWFTIEIAKKTQLQSQVVDVICDTCSVNVSETEYTFMENGDNLDPCITYEFTVIAVNVVGRGQIDRSSTVRSAFLKEPDMAIKVPLMITEHTHCSFMLTIVPHFPYCPGAVPDSYRVFIQKTDNSTLPLVYDSSIVVVSNEIKGDVQALNVHLVSTLLLITQELHTGEKYSLQIEAQNALGRKNITETTTIDIPYEPTQLADAEAHIDGGRLCVTCKFNPAPPTVMQNCTALISSNISSNMEFMRIAWGQHVHSSATECSDTVEPGVYTLRVFSGWEAQCSQGYPVIDLQVEASISKAMRIGDHFHCSTKCAVGIVSAGITTAVVMLTVLLFSLLCTSWRKKQQDLGELEDQWDSSIITKPSVAYEQAKLAIRKHVQALKDPEDQRDLSIITQPNIAHEQPRSIIGQQALVDPEHQRDSSVITQPNVAHEQPKSVIGQQVLVDPEDQRDSSVITQLQPNVAYEQPKSVIGQQALGDPEHQRELSVITQPNVAYEQPKSVIGQQALGDPEHQRDLSVITQPNVAYEQPKSVIGQQVPEDPIYNVIFYGHP